MPWNDGALGPCDHLKAQPLIASIWLQITARDKLIIARASPSTSLIERRIGGGLWLEILRGQ
jgi:hypothetical protein